MQIKDESKVTLVETICSRMLEYQRDNNITKECITNVQYLYDIIVNLGLKDRATVKAFIVVGKRLGLPCIVGGHLVIAFDDYIIEPSYEVSSLHNASYFETARDLLASSSKAVKSNDNMRHIIQNSIKKHLKFVDFAAKINAGEFIICDKSHYNSQADFIEKSRYKTPEGKYVWFENK